MKKNVAMTGEITLRGRVLPIGGLKEKVLAAHRAGIDTVIVPMENRKDIDEIPENVKSQIKFVFAADMDIVLKTALVEQKLRESVKEPAVGSEQAIITTGAVVLPEHDMPSPM